MNSVHEHCSSQKILEEKIFNKVNKNKIKSTKIKQNFRKIKFSKMKISKIKFCCKQYFKCKIYCPALLVNARTMCMH